MYYEILRSDRESSEAKDKAMEEILSKVSKAWLETNMSLFKHVLDYESKLNMFLDKAGGWIREQEECIWTMMFQITGDIGAPLCASLDVLLHLLETLPSFPANLAYQSQSPIICGFAPEAYAQPWLGLHSLNLPHTLSFDSRRKAEDVLKEAIIRSTGGGAAALQLGADLSASTSTVPIQIPRDAETLLLGGLPSSSPLLYALLPSANVPSPLLHSARSPAPLHSGKSSASRATDQGESFKLIEFIGIGFWVWQWQ